MDERICKLCGDPKVQPGRYAEWICRCCDESSRCPHVSITKRLIRRMAGRRT